MRATWKPHQKSGRLTARADLPSSVFAYPKERKEPMTNASHVRNAIARYDQVTGVSSADRELAFANIKKAAKHYGVSMSESKSSDLGSHPKTGRTAADRKKSAAKGARTRKKRAGKKTGSRKKTARKKTTRKKTSHKKSTRKKTTRKKTTRKKTTRKKTTRKKTRKR